MDWDKFPQDVVVAVLEPIKGILKVDWAKLLFTEEERSPDTKWFHNPGWGLNVQGGSFPPWLKPQITLLLSQALPWLLNLAKHPSGTNTTSERESPRHMPGKAPKLSFPQKTCGLQEGKPYGVSKVQSFSKGRICPQLLIQTGMAMGCFSFWTWSWISLTPSITKREGDV